MYSAFQILLLWLAVLAAPAAGFAQGQLLSWAYFGDDKGLNLTELNDIFQDSKGFLWLAAREGLIRFDGHAFRYFRHAPGDTASISSNHVLCIAEDAEGNIWAGLSRGGLSRYDRKTGAFRNYPFTEKLKIRTASVVRIFFTEDHEMWVGVIGYGLVHLDPNTGNFKAYDLVTAQSAPHLTPEELPYYNAAQNFWQDENGLIWCATSDDLYTFDPKTGKAVPLRFEKIAPTGFRQNQAYALLPDGDWLWVGGWGSGLRRYDRKTGEWKQFLLVENSPSPDAVNVVSSIAPKSADELWVASTDQGLGIFNKKTEQFLFLNRDAENYPGFPTGTMGRLYIDRQDNIWLNNDGQLLRVQLKQSQFHFKPTRSAIPVPKENSWISTIFEDREGRFLFIGFYAGDGLHIYDRRTGQKTVPNFILKRSAGESDRQVRDILQDRDGVIWVLGRHALYRFDPLTSRLELPVQPPVYSPELGSNFYNQMTEDNEGNLWLCAALFGVFRYHPRTGQITHFMPDDKKPGAIATNVIGSIKADRQGRVWYGSRDKTAYGYYLPAEDRFVYLDADGQETSEVVSLRMNSLFTDQQGDIWGCSEQGVLHFDCSADRPRLVKKYTVADGLSSDYVGQVVEDNDGHLWLTVAKNLLRLDRTSGQITPFGKQDGTPPFNNGIGKLNDGTLYLKAEQGYYVFNPGALNPVREQAPIVLSSFKVNDRERYQGSELTFSRPLIVPPEGRYFSLEFAALNFTHPELCRYEYKLEGLNEQWVAAGNRHLVNYTNVPAGRYLFKVKLEGTSDSEALAVPLSVRVVFYRTSWFWTLAVASLVGAAFVYFRGRQRERQRMAELLSKAQLLEKEKALVQYESLKQQLNPHFLFNSLTSLGSLIAIDPKAASGFLDSLSKTYRYILKSSEWEVVPLSEELKFGESFVKLQKTRFGEGLQVHFNVGEKDFHWKIVPVTLQNLIENAIKHNIIDEEEPLVVQVFVEKGYLVVRNNLQKKKFVETSNKQGLAYLRSFYRYLSDQPVVVAEDGAFFTVKIPLV